jgi:hypothetical protein
MANFCKQTELKTLGVSSAKAKKLSIDERLKALPQRELKLLLPSMLS